MSADPSELPEPHVRAVYAAMLYRDGLIDATTLRTETRVAFGADTGDVLAEAVIRSATTSERAPHLRHEEAAARSR